MLSLRKKSGGFTIIEVMIVLAIAAIILLIVFLAVPALQRSSRNYERKQAVGLVASSLEEYRGEHRAYPTTPTEICDFLTNFAGAGVGTKTSSCTAAYTPGNECVLVEYNRFNICFHDYANTEHSYLGPDDEVSIILSHWCNNGANYFAGDAGNPITSGGAPIDNLYQRYAVWIQTEGGPAICVDNFPNVATP